MKEKVNRQILLVKRPFGMPDESDFRLVESPLPSPNDREVLIETHYLSVDPNMRGRMSDRRAYAPPFLLDTVVPGSAVGKIMSSRSALFNAGDYVSGMLAWEDYSVASEKNVRKINPELAPVSTALGVLGLPGLTAYFGLLDIGKPKPGETVVISAAAGAVGSVAGQIAKIMSCRVVGIAGSHRKVKYMLDELGFDAAINYKNPSDIRAPLNKSCRDGVDVYFDNVGGEISDAVFALMNDNARIAICGQISLYNMNEVHLGPRVQALLLSHTAHMQGFRVGQYADRFEEARTQLAEWFAQGKIKASENIVEGLENTPRAFLGLFRGENVGKQLVRVC
jgi:NADPH-dependent curcumin reductase CurA